MRYVVDEEEWLRNWESIIDGVEKTDIPAEFVSSIHMEFQHSVDGKDEQIIDIGLYRENGWSDEMIELLIEKILTFNKDNIKSLHFFLDIKKMAMHIQESVDGFLSKYDQ